MSRTPWLDGKYAATAYCQARSLCTGEIPTKLWWWDSERRCRRCFTAAAGHEPPLPSDLTEAPKSVPSK